MDFLLWKIVSKVFAFVIDQYSTKKNDSSHLGQNICLTVEQGVS